VRLVPLLDPARRNPRSEPSFQVEHRAGASLAELGCAGPEASTCTLLPERRAMANAGVPPDKQ